MVTNEDRAQWAENVMETFADETGMDQETEPETILADLLCDLMHYAATLSEGIFEAALADARAHYEHEVGDGCGDN